MDHCLGAQGIGVKADGHHPAHGHARQLHIRAHPQARGGIKAGGKLEALVGEEFHAAQFDGQVGHTDQAQQHKDAHGGFTDAVHAFFRLQTAA